MDEARRPTHVSTPVSPSKMGKKYNFDFYYREAIGSKLWKVETNFKYSIGFNIPGFTFTDLLWEA